MNKIEKSHREMWDKHKNIHLQTVWETEPQSLHRKDFYRRKWQPTPVFFPGKSRGQRTLAGYSPWGYKELDMTDQLTHTNSTRRTGEREKKKH